MIDKTDKCYYCNKLAIAERRECVDVEGEPDFDEVTGKTIWISHGVYANIQVCAEHMNDDEEMLEKERKE